MADGKEREIAMIAPGKEFSVNVPAKQIVMARNSSNKTAVMTFKLTFRVARLSMRYDHD